MKLFNKYNRTNIAAAIFTFLAGSIGFYVILNYVLVGQLDRSLRVEEQEILTFIKKNNHFPEIHDTRHQWIQKKVTKQKIESPSPSSTVEYNPQANITEHVRQYRFNAIVEGQLIEVTVNQSITETEELLRLIILVTLGMIALMLLLNYLITRKLLNKLWRPFYATLQQISEYKMSSRKPLELPSVDIDEINMLNAHLNNMTERIRKDYQSLKEFTENASHEMQTPLAVIRSRVEELLQDQLISEKSSRQLAGIEDAVMKLSKLQQALILLAKLENRQFEKKEEVALHKIVVHWVDMFADLFSIPTISVDVEIKETIVSTDPYMADILVSNLIKNAIRYTAQEGRIYISLDANRLLIANSANGESLDSERLFKRFYRVSGNATDSTGLGLAIVKEICVAAGWHITYAYKNGMHHFQVEF